MKKILLITFSCLLFIMHLDAQPGSSTEPLTAVEGTNISFYNTTYELYYQYVMPCNGLLTFTAQSVNYLWMEIYIKNGSWLQSVSLNGSNSTSVSASKNDTLLIRTNSSAPLAVWSISVSTEIPEGLTVEKPFQASLGLNHSDNSKGNQWFEYTPEKDGLLELSTCGLTNYDTYVVLYDGINNEVGRNDQYCNGQSYLSYKVYTGRTYFIKWSNLYTSSSYDWNLSIGELAKETDIKYFDLIETENYNSILSREPEIDATNHKVTAYASKNSDLSNTVMTIFGTSNGATISYNGNFLNKRYWNNKISFYNYEIFNNTTKTYSIIAQDGENSQNWDISVYNESELSDENSFTSYIVSGDTGLIDETNHIVYVNVYGTDLTSLYSTFTASKFSSISRDTLTYESSEYYYLDYTDTIHFNIVSESGISQEWRVIPIQGPGQSCEDPIVATYGTTYGNGQYYQIFSFTSSDSGLVSFKTTDNDEYIYLYSGTCDNQDLLQTGTNYVFNVTKGTTYHLLTYGLYSAGLIISKTSVIHKEITNFYSYNSYYGSEYAIIDTINNTVDLSVGYRVDLQDMNYGFYYSNPYFNIVTIGDSVISTYSYGDYSKPVVYTITSSDSTKTDYTITVTKRSAVKAELFAYAISNQIGNAVIDPYTHTIKIGIDTTGGVNITNLKPIFRISQNAYLTDENDITQESGFSTRDFSDTVKYDLYGEDYSVVRWNVIPVIGQSAKNNQADIVAYHFFMENEKVEINKSGSTINIELPNGTDYNSLISWFTLSNGATAKVNSIGQTSGISANNFKNSVIYTITAEDGLTKKDWTVTVKIINNETKIISYSIPGQVSSSINKTTKTVLVRMPVGEDITNLVSNFTLSDQATAVVNGVLQISGTTANNFSTSLNYVVIAGDGSTQDWTVTVSNKPVTTTENIANSVVAYPNPNDGNFILKLNSENSTTANLSIVSLDGRCILQKELYLDGETTETLNLNVASGTYIVRIVSGNTINNQCIQIIR